MVPVRFMTDELLEVNGIEAALPSDQYYKFEERYLKQRRDLKHLVSIADNQEMLIWTSIHL